MFSAEIPAKIERLCDALRKAASPVVRQVICNLLASLESPQALPCLLEALSDSTTAVVAAAEDAIGNCSAGMDVGEELRRSLGSKLLSLLVEEGSETPVRTGAIYALGLMRYGEAVSALLEALESPLPIVRWGVAEALSHMGDPVAIDSLRSRYGRETEERVKRNIRAALINLAA